MLRKFKFHRWHVAVQQISPFTWCAWAGKKPLGGSEFPGDIIRGNQKPIYSEYGRSRRRVSRRIFAVLRRVGIN